MINTISGANASVIIYSIAKTAKANNLKPYNYFEYLLAEIPKHMGDHDMSFCEDLLPWSEKIQRNAENNLRSVPLLEATNQRDVPTMKRLQK